MSSRSARSPTGLAARPSPAARARRGARRRSARAAAGSSATPCRVELVDQPAVGRTGAGRRPAARCAPASSAHRKPQPAALETPTCSSAAPPPAAGSARISSKAASASPPPSYSRWRISPLAAVDLQRHRRLAEGLLVEPAVGLELEPHVLLARPDAPVQLRVADRVAAPRRQHEVGKADDLDLAPGERRRRVQPALVDDPLAAPRPRRSSPRAAPRGAARRCRRASGTASGAGARARSRAASASPRTRPADPPRRPARAARPAARSATAAGSRRSRWRRSAARFPEPPPRRRFYSTAARSRWRPRRPTVSPRKVAELSSRRRRGSPVRPSP